MASIARNLSAPTLLSQAHDSSSFNSGEPLLDNWLRERAWRNLLSAASRTYVVCPVNSCQVIAYFSLAMGHILTQETQGAMRRNMPRHIPAVIVGRFALDSSYQGQGLGAALLAHVVERVQRAGQQIATRLLIVHAISPAAEAFYLHHGFTRLPLDTPTPTLALDLIKLHTLSRP